MSSRAVGDLPDLAAVRAGTEVHDDREAIWRELIEGLVARAERAIGAGGVDG